jgi:hypothetical protein
VAENVIRLQRDKLCGDCASLRAPPIVPRAASTSHFLCHGRASMPTRGGILNRCHARPRSSLRSSNVPSSPALIRLTSNAAKSSGSSTEPSPAPEPADITFEPDYFEFLF